MNEVVYDLALVGHGPFTMITPLTPTAVWCIGAYLKTEPYQWAGDSLFVSSELIPDILETLRPWCRVQGRGGSGCYISETKLPIGLAIASKDRSG